MDLPILDAAAGPIPPGIAPQVDVMWSVMTEENCSDTFGKRVAQSMYCIQATIGNNSGHAILLAGIGFKPKIKEFKVLGSPEILIPNNSYVSTRAILAHAQLLSTRNLVANGIQGAGLLMAGGIPYFSGSHQPNAKTHYLTAVSILSGPVVQAFNLLFPDPIIGELKNLDDQSLRDNLVIANNSQVRTTVFVEKKSISIPLRDLKIQLNAAAAKIEKAKCDDKTDGSATCAAKNQEIDIMNQEWSKTSDDVDSTHDNAQARRSLRKKKFNPLLAKLALCDMVIVGDEIEYLQRVQIQANPNPPVNVSVVPGQQSVMLTTTQKFTATVTGSSNASVTWSVVDSQGTPSNIGSIATDGTYTAPATATLPTTNVVTVKAVSAADPSKSATATVTITPILVQITPPSTTVRANASTPAFTANTPVTWRVISAAGTGAIDPNSGVYTAPAGTGTGIIQATSTVDTTKTATVTITITP